MTLHLYDLLYATHGSSSDPSRRWPAFKKRTRNSVVLTRVAQGCGQREIDEGVASTLPCLIPAVSSTLHQQFHQHPTAKLKTCSRTMFRE